MSLALKSLNFNKDIGVISKEERKAIIPVNVVRQISNKSHPKLITIKSCKDLIQKISDKAFDEFISIEFE